MLYYRVKRKNEVIAKVRRVGTVLLRHRTCSLGFKPTLEPNFAQYKRCYSGHASIIYL